MAPSLRLGVSYVFIPINRNDEIRGLQKENMMVKRGTLIKCIKELKIVYCMQGGESHLIRTSKRNK